MVTVFISLLSPERNVYPSLVSEKKFSVGSICFQAEPAWIRILAAIGF